MPNARSDTIRSLARGLDTLTALSACQPASLHTLHLETGLAKPVLLRILNTLEERGYIFRGVRDRRYRTNQLRRPGSSRPTLENLLLESAAPLLDGLAEMVSWPADLAVRDGDDMLVVDTNRHKAALFVPYSTSFVFRPSMMRSAHGRAYLAFCPEAEREAIVEALSGSEEPDNFPARDHKFVARLVNETRRQGYGLKDPDYFPKRLVIGAPIFDGDNVMGTVTLGCLSNTMPVAQFVKNNLQTLLSVAGEISARFTELAGQTNVQQKLAAAKKADFQA